MALAQQVLICHLKMLRRLLLLLVLLLQHFLLGKQQSLQLRRLLPVVQLVPAAVALMALHLLAGMWRLVASHPEQHSCVLRLATSTVHPYGWFPHREHHGGEPVETEQRVRSPEG